VLLLQILEQIPERAALSRRIANEDDRGSGLELLRNALEELVGFRNALTAVVGFFAMLEVATKSVRIVRLELAARLNRAVRSGRKKSAP